MENSPKIALNQYWYFGVVIACEFCLYIYTTIWAVCKWVFTNMSFSNRAAAIRQRSSPKSQVIFAFVFSWIGDFFVFFGLIFVKLRRVCVFLSWNACGYAASRRGLSRVVYFITLNGPLNGHPPSPLLKVVGFYDLSVLSMSVMGFQKKSLEGGWVGWALSKFFWIFGICLTLQSPLVSLYGFADWLSML